MLIRINKKPEKPKVDDKPFKPFDNMLIGKVYNMALFSTSIEYPEDGDPNKAVLTITFNPPQGDQSTISLPLVPDTSDLDIFQVNMHSSATPSYNMGPAYNDWFSNHFGFSVVFVYLGQYQRQVLFSTTNSKPASESWFSSITNAIPPSITGLITGTQENIAFNDVAPYLIASETSLKNVSDRLPDGDEMDIIKFRPNIIVTGAAEAWEEDYWAEMKIGNATIRLLHNCVRCMSINVDYQTGAIGTGPSGKILQSLQKDRRVDTGFKNSPVFGRYSFLSAGSEGKTISVGDEVVITKRNKERTVFGEQAASAL